ncbi:MAG: collagen-like protein [Flavobacteriaceae bacterium]
MKKGIILPLIIITMFLTACEGPQGPPGQDGLDGINILGQVFERTVDFQYFPNNGSPFYQAPLIQIPSNIEVYESDVILVYRYEGTEGGLDIWGPIPQNFFLDNGLIIQYVFNYTFVDVLITIDGNLIGNELGSGFTNDQTFRIAIVPAEYGNANLTMEQLENSAQVEFIGN